MRDIDASMPTSTCLLPTSLSIYLERRVRGLLSDYCHEAPQQPLLTTTVGRPNYSNPVGLMPTVLLNKGI